MTLLLKENPTEYELRRRVLAPRVCEVQRHDGLAKALAWHWLERNLDADIAALEKYLNKKLNLRIQIRVTPGRFKSYQRMVARIIK